MANVSDSVPVDELKDLLTCSLCSTTLNDQRACRACIVFVKCV